MIIMCDMDGVLNNFVDHLIDTFDYWGYKFDYENYKTFNIEKYILGATKKEQSKIMSAIMENLSWWDGLEPLEDSYSVLKSLYTNPKVDLFIATSPWAEEPKYKIQKLRWMKKHFNFIPQNKIVFSNKKWELPGDLIIEDKPETLNKCAEKMLTICHTQPYNKDVAADYHFDSWAELPKIFKKIIK